MNGYIYDPHTLVAVADFAASGYQLPMEFVSGETGTISTPDKLRNFDRHFVKLDGFDAVWRISGQSVKNNVTTLSIEDALTALNGMAAKTSISNDLTVSASTAIALLGGGVTGVDGYAAPAYVDLGDSFLPQHLTVDRLCGFSFYSHFSQIGATTSANPNQSHANGLTSLAVALLDPFSGEDIVRQVTTKSGSKYALLDLYALLTQLRARGYAVTAHIISTPGDGFALPNDALLRVNSAPYILAAGDTYIVRQNRVTEFAVERLQAGQLPGYKYLWAADAAPYQYGGELRFTTEQNLAMSRAGSLGPLLRRTDPTKAGLKLYTPPGAEMQSVLALRIDQYGGDPLPVIMGDGHHELTEYTATRMGMVTHVRIPYALTLSQNYDKFCDYYLRASGEVTASDYAQIPGQLLTKFDTPVTTWENGLPLAEEEFTKNKVEHKLTFKSEKIYHVGQRIRAVMETETIDTVISSVTVSSDDSRRTYRCGDLATSASEKLRSNSWRYGQRLPLNPYVGQLVFT